MGKKYNRNIGAKKYHTLAEVYDSVNNDPKRPGYQIAHMDRTGSMSINDWWRYISGTQYRDSLVQKTVTVDGVAYYVMIIEATPEEVTALQICF